MHFGKSSALFYSCAIFVLASCSRAPVTPPSAPSTGVAFQQGARFNPNVESQNGVPSVAMPALQRLVAGPRVAPPSVARRFAGGALYTAQYYGNDARVYSMHNLRIEYAEEITGGLVHPQGTATAIKPAFARSRPEGAWYIANTGASNVPVYTSTSRGPVGPSEILDDAGQYPVDVSASAAHELVAVSNALSTTFTPGSVSLYAHGSRTPTGSLSARGIVLGVGIAIDSRGNCYWSYDDVSNLGGAIVRFEHCAGRPITVVSGLHFAGGLAFDGRDDLYYTDQAVGLYKCSRLVRCRLIASGFGDPLFINFDKDWSHLWLADATGLIDAIDPQSGAIESSTHAADGRDDPPFGVAPAP